MNYRSPTVKYLARQRSPQIKCTNNNINNQRKKRKKKSAELLPDLAISKSKLTN
jgi:hypothetical protein